MKNKYNINIRIPKEIHLKMLEDLKREHDFAHERVGFLFTTTKQISEKEVIVLAKEYISVDDEDYIEDYSVGAKINSTAIRKAMQRVLENSEGCFHVHLHNHSGKPYPSHTDNKGIPPVISSFSNVSNRSAHGFLILSRDTFYASVKYNSETNLITPELISVVGYPFNFSFTDSKKVLPDDIFNRQNFLGNRSKEIFKKIKVGIIGYGGGGSHIGQQLAHLGVENIFVFDNDKIETTNLNRLIGAWFTDVKNKMLKTAIAKRTISKILPTSKVICINTRWQENANILQSCDIVFGCVDSYAERQQLEAECRRYLIPLIDIGMDVHKTGNDNYSMSGQIILSMPGSSCMSCFGFLTESKLALEAAKYGNVGGRPQVVWPNGVLASTAIGVFVDLVTGWTNTSDRKLYLAYDGNSGRIEDHVRVKFADETCKHYPFLNIGSPFFKKL